MTPVSSSAAFLTLLVIAVTLITSCQVAAHAQTTAGVRTASWRVTSVRNAGFVMDRVALLTTEREKPDAPWCMGLLVAPDALLTYAHCVAEITKQSGSDKRVAWAFFGNTKESFYETQSPPPEPTEDNEEMMMKGQSGAESFTSSAADGRANATLVNGTTSSNNSSRRRHDSDDVEVGDVANWVEVLEVVLHPEFNQTANSTRSPAADMAIVRIAAPRETEPFRLLPDVVAVENSTDVQMTNTLEAYRVTDAFISNENVPKAQPIGPFLKINWFFCALASNESTVVERKHAVASQMCVVPEAVSKRVSLSTINSFVLVGDQLAGLSVCHSKVCRRAVVHPYVLVSAIKDFIELATRKQDVWTDIKLFTIGGSDTMLQGYLSGLRKTKAADNFCLGTLIGPQFVLTAAHCVKGMAFSYVSVGSKFASSVSDGEQIKVRSVKIHPAFDPKTLLNDFALVELQYMSIQTPLVLDNESIQQLYSSTSTLVLYGYAGGADVKQSVDKPVIQSLTLPLVKNSVCNSLIGDSSMDAAIVCAGGDQGKDGCQGDSGAPLILDSGTSDPSLLVALSSFGWGCGIKGVPAVYAKVSAAKSFIEKYAQGHTWRYPLNQDSAGGGTTAGGSSSTGATTTGSSSPAAQNSPSPSTMSPSEEERSGEGTISGGQQHTVPATAGATTSRDSADEFVESICREEKWTCAATISLLGALQSIVIPATTSQFTRDSVATILLASKDHVPHEEIRVTTASSSDSDSDIDAISLTRYSCAGPIQMYSSGDMSSIEARLASFEDRPLRRRKARFPRAPGLVRLPEF